MLLNWILGMLMPAAPGQNSVSGFLLFAAQIIVLVVQLVLVGRARRYTLQAERHEMRAEENARAAERNERLAEEHQAPRSTTRFRR